MDFGNKVITPYDGDDPYIFVSYSHRDTKTLKMVVGQLGQNHYRVWYDSGIDVGKAYSDVIAKRIENSSYFIALISQNFLASEDCVNELEHAKYCKKERCLIYIEDVDLPEGLKMNHGRLQAIYQYKDLHYFDRLIKVKEISCCQDLLRDTGDSNKPHNREKSDKTLQMAISICIIGILLLIISLKWLNKLKVSTEVETSHGETNNSNYVDRSDDIKVDDYDTPIELTTEHVIGIDLVPLTGTSGFIDEGFENLFDGNQNTKWCVPFRESASVTWKMSEPVIVECLSLTSASDNSKYPGRNPASLLFLGSKNNETFTKDNWSVLYIRDPTAFTRHDDEDFFLEEIEMTKELPAFQYYKIEFTSTTGTDILQLSEIDINYTLNSISTSQ